MNGDQKSGPERAETDAASWLVLGSVVLLLLLSLAQTLYRLTLPGDGWSFARDITGNSERLTFRENLGAVSSPLKPGDRLLAVQGQSLDDILSRALTSSPQRPPNWVAGGTVEYTVLRGSEELALQVSLTRLTPAMALDRILRTFVIDPSLIPSLLIGFIVFIRRPRSQAARLLLVLCGAFFASDGLSMAVTGSNVVGLAELFYPAAYWPAQFFNTLIWLFVIGPVYLHLFLVFPVRKPVVERHPNLVLILYGWMPVLLLVAVISSLGRPLVFHSILDALGRFDLFLTVILAIVIAAHTLRTVHEATQQAQIRWVAWGLIVTSIGALSGGVLAALGLLGQDLLVDLLAYRLLFLAFPGSLAVAILRYRLFEIDVVIRRTLIYGVLSGLLAAVYFASIFLLQRFFLGLTGQTQSGLGVVISILGIALLFVPLRERVQQAIDWRFYRRKYDLEKTLAAFGVQARDEVDLDQLADDLLTLVGETMQPAHVSLWLTKTGSADGDE